MDNSKNGGNRVDDLERRGIFGVPESFESLYESGNGQSENVSADKDVNRELGEAAGVMREIFGENGVGVAGSDDAERAEGGEKVRDADGRNIRRETVGAPEAVGMPEVAETPEMTLVEELRPLIADGTTEKKLGKIGVSLVGEGVDAVGISEVVKEIENRPLSEQSAARDSASAKLIYANFGRMIGNDDIGEIQAEESALKRNTLEKNRKAKNAGELGGSDGAAETNDISNARGVA